MKIKNKVHYVGAFILPIVCMQICLRKLSIGWDGDATILTWDLSGQYIAFLAYLREMLLGHVSATYTLVGGYGSALAGMIAYYLGSPFNIILLFFNNESIPTGIALLIQVKVACMGLFMYMLLQSREKSKVAIFFSTAYSLCAYVVAYESNVMWLDALVFLPLVVWGMDKIMETGSGFLYVVSMGLTMMSCYYTAYMVCLFSGIYFIGCCLLKNGRTIKEKGICFVKFIGYSLGAVSLSAFILLPGVRQLIGGERGWLGLKTIANWARLYFQQSLLPMFLACSYTDGQRWEVGAFPLVYCGILSVFGVISFLCSNKIQWRKKVVAILVGSFLLISYNHMNLFIMWHGFYSPFGAPWRFAFIGSFFMVLTAYEGTVQILKGDKFAGKLSFIGMILFLTWICLRFPAYRQIALFNVLVFLGECLYFMFRPKKPENKTFMHYGMAFVALSCLVIELCVNTLYTWNQGFKFDSKSAYETYINQMEQVLVKDESQRSEILESTRRSVNDGFLFQLNTLSVYSSTERMTNYRLRYRMGFGHQQNSQYSTALARKISGLKYIYCAQTDEKIIGSEDANENSIKGYHIAEKSDQGICRLEDDNVLPLAYVVKPEAIRWKDQLIQEENLFENQNRIYSLLAGSDGEIVYIEKPERKLSIYSSITSVESGMISYLGNSLYTDGNDIYEEDYDKIRHTITLTADTLKDIEIKDAAHMKMRVDNILLEDSYVCVTVPYEKSWKAKVNGQTVDTMEGMGGFLLIPVEHGTSTVEIEYDLLEQKVGNWLSIIALIGLGALAGLEWKKKSHIKIF